jgi:hypothetical protein
VLCLEWRCSLDTSLSAWLMRTSQRELCQVGDEGPVAGKAVITPKLPRPRCFHHAEHSSATDLGCERAGYWIHKGLSGQSVVLDVSRQGREFAGVSRGERARTILVIEPG